MSRRPIAAAILGVALVAFLSLSCAPTRTRRKDAAPLDDPLFKYAQQLFLAGDFRGAALAFSDVIVITSSRELQAEALYWRGLSYVKIARYEEAQADFLACMQRTDESDLTAKVWMGLGDAYLMQADFSQASSAFSTALQRYPERIRTDEVLYKLSLAHIRGGSPQKAVPFLDDLSSNFPDSDFADIARDILAHATTGIAAQLGAFRNEKAAKTLAADLGSRGISARVEPMTRRSVSLYAVRSGSCRSWQEALRYVQNFRSQGIEAIVFP